MRKAGRIAVCVVLSAWPAIARGQRAPAVHALTATAATVHRGFFDASLAPVLTIDSGDIVRLETATGNPKWFEDLGVPKEKIPAELYTAYEGCEGRGRGDHTLNGPIAIRSGVCAGGRRAAQAVLGRDRGGAAAGDGTRPERTAERLRRQSR